jgi:hypothetical protein
MRRASRWHLSAGPRLPAAFLVATALLPALAACGPPSTDDPVVHGLKTLLRPEDRLLVARVLDADDATRIAAVVRPASGKPELRIYERRAAGAPYLVVHTSQQGDRFHNLVLEDVNGDGQEEILATWTGGQLEILEVLGRAPDGTYRTLFQNAGQRIEQRYGATGSVEFWISSRTFEEGSGQPPTYGIAIYRWDGKGFSEAVSR